MASFGIHLAIGKRYCEKVGMTDGVKEIYRGIIAPDLVENKMVSHYSGELVKGDLVNNLPNKVLLTNFLTNENIDTDYQKGVFLHLITDYLFFNDFFDKEFIAGVSYLKFCEDLYYSYDTLDKYLVEKYSLDYSDFSDALSENIAKTMNKFQIDKEEYSNILPTDKVDEFIERVSSIDLEKYKTLILMSGTNVLPTDMSLYSNTSNEVVNTAIETIKAGCFLINQKSWDVALVYREKQKDYSFPKGHVEIGEDALSAAIRETAEETKRVAVVLDEFEPYVERYTIPNGERCVCYMYAAIDGGHSDNNSMDTHDVVWVPFDLVEKKLSYDSLKEMWREVKDKIKTILE